MNSLQAIDDALARCFDALKPSPDRTIEQWLIARDGVILPEKGNARPGRVDLDWTPYLRAPLNDFTDRHVDTIGLCFARQVGKTTYVFTTLGYVIDEDPGPGLLFYPTEKAAMGVSKDRIMPIIMATPILREHMTDDPDDMTNLAYRLDRMTLRFGHAGSEVSAREQSIRYLWIDEPSAMDVGSVDNVRDTTSSFWNRRVVLASTPRHDLDPMWSFLGLKPKDGMKGEALWDTDAYEPKTATTVYMYYVQCLHCSEWIQFLWRQLRWPTDIPIREIPAHGWYECQSCKMALTNSDKTKMVSKGQWMPHESQRDGKPGKWKGYHLNSMYGPWDSCRFGEIAMKGLRARQFRDPEKVERFVNNTLALPYSIQNESVELVDETAIKKNVLAYSRNTIPEACKVLTLGWDVGAHAVHWIIQGFGASGKSWRIAWGVCDTLYDLEKYVRSQAFTHPKAGPMVMYVGAGDSRYDKQEVLRFCKRMRGRMFPVQGERTIKNDPGRAGTLPHKAYKPERDSNGKARADSMTGYRINTVFYKQAIFSRINCLYSQPPCFFFPQEHDDEFYRHINSEEEVTIRKKGSAEIQKVWQLKAGYAQNHWFDAMVYGYAVAEIFGIMAHRADGPVLTGVKQTQQKADPGQGQSDGRGTSGNPMGFGKVDY